MIDSRIIKDIASAIKNEGSGPTPYDTTARVVRVEDGVAWVHIPGGVDETPAELTIDAKVGDTVQVRVSGGRAFLIGNNTAPPTDDTKANEAQESTDELRAYVATHIQETDEGLLVTKDNSQWKLLIKSDGVDVIDPSGSVVANYSGQVRIGREDAENITVTNGEVRFNAEDGSNALRTVFFPVTYLSGTVYGVKVTNDVEDSYILLTPSADGALDVHCEAQNIELGTSTNESPSMTMTRWFTFGFANSQTAGSVGINATTGLTVSDHNGNQKAAIDWDGNVTLPAVSWGVNKVAVYGKQAGVVSVFSSGTALDVNIPTATWTTVATLPAGYRPSRIVRGMALLSMNKVGAVQITTGGAVQVQVNSATGAIASGSSIYFNLSFAL